ncbi:MAG: hypothetical protein AB7N76_08950 [Planctomycetota bacterium]
MQRLFIAAALVAVSAPLAVAGGLDKKQARSLESAKKALDKAEAKLAESEGESKKPYQDRTGESLERALERAHEQLKELPADGEGVADGLERAKQLQQRLRALIEAKGSLGARAFLGSKTATSLNYLDGRMTSNANQLAKLAQEGASFGDRDKDGLTKALADVDAKLAELPAENPIVQQLKKRQEEAKAAFGRLCSGLGAKKEAAADAEAARQALLSSPDFAKDVERVKALVETVAEDGLFLLDAGYLRNPLDSQAFDQAKGIAEQWSSIAPEAQGFLAKYESLLRARANEMRFPLSELKERFPRLELRVQTFVSQAPAAAAAAAKEARELAAAAIGRKDHRAFSDILSPLHAKSAYVRRVAELAARLGIKELLAAAGALDDQLAAEEEKLAADIVAGNRAPKNAYARADRAALEAFVGEHWGKSFAKEEVLAVRFPNESFQRTVAWRWDSGRKQHYKVDQSDLWIRVLVAKGEEAVIYVALLRKLHLEDDRLILRWERPKHLPPSARMLRKNLD